MVKGFDAIQRLKLHTRYPFTIERSRVYNRLGVKIGGASGLNEGCKKTARASSIGRWIGSRDPQAMNEVVKVPCSFS